MKKVSYLFLLPVLSLFAFSSCEKEQDDINLVVQVTLEPNQSYEYQINNFGDKDAEVKITTQAAHALKSSLSPISNSDSYLFEYTPALNFSGSDQVIVSAEDLNTNSCGRNGSKGCNDDDEDEDQITFQIHVKGSSE